MMMRAEAITTAWDPKTKTWIRARVRIQIDPQGLADNVRHKILRNKKGRSTQAHGAIVVEVIHRTTLEAPK